jgi:hypothetical protein
VDVALASLYVILGHHLLRRFHFLRNCLRHTMAAELRAREFPSGRSWACSATRAILLELLNYARFRPNYLGRAVQAIDAYFADLRKELGHLLPDAVFNPMHASSVLVPKGGGPQRLEKLVGATGIEPVTPAMSTQCSYR